MPVSKIRQWAGTDKKGTNAWGLIKAAEKMGWLDGTRGMMETLTAIKRAGADLILTYFAMDAAALINA